MLLLIGGDSEIGAATILHLVRHARARDDAPSRACGLGQPLNDWEPPTGANAACIFAAVSRLAACAIERASAFINVEQTLALAARLLARGIQLNVRRQRGKHRCPTHRLVR
jgi:hypothetical protein